MDFKDPYEPCRFRLQYHHSTVFRTNGMFRSMDVVGVAHLGHHLGFWKSQANIEFPPRQNFIYPPRTIEKCKKMIVTRDCTLQPKYGLLPPDYHDLGAMTTTMPAVMSTSCGCWTPFKITIGSNFVPSAMAASMTVSFFWYTNFPSCILVHMYHILVLTGLFHRQHQMPELKLSTLLSVTVTPSFRDLHLIRADSYIDTVVTVSCLHDLMQTTISYLVHLTCSSDARCC